MLSTPSEEIWSLFQPPTKHQSLKLTYGNETIISDEGSQQGDPLSSLEYCDTAQPTLLATTSRTKLRFVDDTNLEGKISQVANDVQHIIDSHQLRSSPEFT